MIPCCVGLEQLCHLSAPRFNDVARQPFQTRCWCARTWVELRDVEYWKFVFLDQLYACLVVLISLCWKSTNDISGNQQTWDFCSKTIDQMSEIS